MPPACGWPGSCKGLGLPVVLGWSGLGKGPGLPYVLGWSGLGKGLDLPCVLGVAWRWPGKGLDLPSVVDSPMTRHVGASWADTQAHNPDNVRVVWRIISSSWRRRIGHELRHHIKHSLPGRGSPGCWYCCSCCCGGSSCCCRG